MNLIQQTLQLLGFQKSSSPPRRSRRCLRVERLESRELFAIGDGTLYYANADGDRWYPPEFRYDATTQEVVITAQSYKNLGLRAEVHDDGSGPRLDYWVPTEQSSFGKALPGDYVPTTFQTAPLSHKWLAGGRPVAGIRFIGSEGRDTFINDTSLPLQAWGHGGNDKLVGGRAADRLHGGAGIDTLQGGDGDDFLNGGADADILRGQMGNDVLYGEGGNDELFGGEGDDVLLGGDNNDKLFGDDDENDQEVNRRIWGVSGTLVATRSLATAVTFNDIMLGGSGNDYLEGQSGSDLLVGGTQNDELKGGDDHDYLYGDESPLVVTHSFAGGRMTPTLTYSAAYIEFAKAHYDVESAADVRQINPLALQRGRLIPNGIVVQWTKDREMFNKWAHRGDTRSTDQLFGGAGHDLLVGSNALDTLHGSSGSDALFGGGGNDTLDPGLLARGDIGDVAIGGNGEDTLVVGYWNDATIPGRLQQSGSFTWAVFRPLLDDAGNIVLGRDEFEIEVAVSLRLAQLADLL